MAYAQHHRVSFGGSLAATSAGESAEIWVCTVNVTGRDAEDFNEEAYLAAIAQPLATWFALGDSHIIQSASLEYVKCNQIAPDGKYDDPSVTHRHDFNPVVNGVAAAIDPDIISIALSWTTAKARGPGAHGRIFLPNASVGVAGKMSISSDNCAILANQGKLLLELLGNADNDGPAVFPVIASKVNATNTTITGCKVGTVKDVQRSRKNKLRETYSYVAAPPL